MDSIDLQFLEGLDIKEKTNIYDISINAWESILRSLDIKDLINLVEVKPPIPNMAKCLNEKYTGFDIHDLYKLVIIYNEIGDDDDGKKSRMTIAVYTLANKTICEMHKPTITDNNIAYIIIKSIENNLNFHKDMLTNFIRNKINKSSVKRILYHFSNISHCRKVVNSDCRWLLELVIEIFVEKYCITQVLNFYDGDTTEVLSPNTGLVFSNIVTIEKFKFICETYNVNFNKMVKQQFTNANIYTYISDEKLNYIENNPLITENYYIEGHSFRHCITNSQEISVYRYLNDKCTEAGIKFQYSNNPINKMLVGIMYSGDKSMVKYELNDSLFTIPHNQFSVNKTKQENIEQLSTIEMISYQDRDRAEYYSPYNSSVLKMLCKLGDYEMVNAAITNSHLVLLFHNHLSKEELYMTMLLDTLNANPLTSSHMKIISTVMFKIDRLVNSTVSVHSKKELVNEEKRVVGYSKRVTYLIYDIYCNLFNKDLQYYFDEWLELFHMTITKCMYDSPQIFINIKALKVLPNKKLLKFPFYNYYQNMHRLQLR